MRDRVKKVRLVTFSILGLLLISIGVVAYLLYTAQQNTEVIWGFKLVKDGEQYREVSATHNEIDFGPFTIEAPKEYHILQMTRPYDSYVGGLTNGEDRIMFDYGWYSSDLRDDGNISRDTLNGQIVYYKHPKKGEKGRYAMGLYGFDDQNKLIISANEHMQAEAVEEIFKSLKIKKKSSRLNSRNFGNNYNNHEQSKAKTMFENNCSSCHSINKVMVGPALGGILKRRKMDWLIKWVQNPQKMVAAKDPEALKLVQDYSDVGLMPSFAAMKKDEIVEIIQYVNSSGLEVVK